MADDHPTEPPTPAPGHHQPPDGHRRDRKPPFPWFFCGAILLAVVFLGGLIWAFSPDDIPAATDSPPSNGGESGQTVIYANITLPEAPKFYVATEDHHSNPGSNPPDEGSRHRLARGSGNIAFLAGSDSWILNLDEVEGRHDRNTVSFNTVGDEVSVVVKGPLTNWSPSSTKAVPLGACRLVEAYGDARALVGATFENIADLQERVWANSLEKARIEILRNPATGESSRGTEYCEFKLVDLSGSSSANSGGSQMNSANSGSNTPASNSDCGKVVDGYRIQCGSSFDLNLEGGKATFPFKFVGYENSQIKLTCYSPTGTLDMYAPGNWATSNNGQTRGWVITQNSQTLAGVSGTGIQFWPGSTAQRLICSWTAN